MNDFVVGKVQCETSPWDVDRPVKMRAEVDLDNWDCEKCYKLLWAIWDVCVETEYKAVSPDYEPRLPDDCPLCKGDIVLTKKMKERGEEDEVS